MYERDMRKLDPAISGTSICLEPAISGSIRHIPFSCLTEEKNEPTVMEKQEVNFMSFSGVCFAEGKILAFSDSKSTQYVNGFPYYIGNVKKIFKNQQFIVTCTGSNNLPLLKNSHMELQRLEDWMNENISEDMTVFSLCQHLYEYFNTDVATDLNNVVLTGTYRKKELGKNQCIFVRSEIGCDMFCYKKQLITKAETWYYGADEYMDYFDHHRWELISSSKEYLQNVLESTIKKIQHKLGPGGYNPVGVPVCVEEFI